MLEPEEREWLGKFTPVFHALLHNHCEAYLLSNKDTYSSPKWYQYQGFTGMEDDSEVEVRFKSSQCSMAFYMPIAKGDRRKLELISYMDVYQHFRSLKYAYLSEHFPQI